jgi:hypothetical protein
MSGESSDITSKNDVLTSILMFFHQKLCRGATLPTFPLPTGFTVITDHPNTREFPPGFGLQCGACISQHFNQFLVPGRVKCRGRRVLSRAGFWLFLSIVILPQCSGWIPGPQCPALLHICQKLGQVGQYCTDPVVNGLHGPQLN